MAGSVMTPPLETPDIMLWSGVFPVLSGSSVRCFPHQTDGDGSADRLSWTERQVLHESNPVILPHSSSRVHSKTFSHRFASNAFGSLIPLKALCISAHSPEAEGGKQLGPAKLFFEQLSQAILTMPALFQARTRPSDRQYAKEKILLTDNPIFIL